MGSREFFLYCEVSYEMGGGAGGVNIFFQQAAEGWTPLTNISQYLILLQLTFTMNNTNNKHR